MCARARVRVRRSAALTGATVFLWLCGAARRQPGKGDFLTVASEDRTFECHINASKVARVTLTDEPAKLAAGHTLHVVRFLGGDGAPVLSVLLMWAPNDGPGHYLHGAVDAFRALRDRYGGDFSL